MEWQQWARRFLEALMGEPGRITPHPPYSGDQDEREWEREEFERETRHVGSEADEPHPAPPKHEEQPPAA